MGCIIPKEGTTSMPRLLSGFSISYRKTDIQHFLK
jgi:hypothetical protein